jgi:hypothetical protein
MNKYVAWSDARGLTMGHNDTRKLPLYPYARRYTLTDNFFTALAPLKSHDGLPGEITMLRYDVLPRSRIVGVRVFIRILSGV